MGQHDCDCSLQGALQRVSRIMRPRRLRAATRRTRCSPRPQDAEALAQQKAVEAPRGTPGIQASRPGQAEVSRERPRLGSQAACRVTLAGQ